MTNILHLAQDLIRLPSITPYDGGCLEYIEVYLKPLGFRCHRFDVQGTCNLYAKLDRGGKNYCFAGHTDVVPVIDESRWAYHPFRAEIHDGILYGRGAVDMKGAIAAYLAALPALFKSCPNDSFSLLLTSDEEGEATYGTQIVIEWLKEKKERVDVCLVGEPTSVHFVGDTLKTGRRGSLNGIITIRGLAGHVAYPHLARNPIPSMLTFLQAIQEPLDKGIGRFGPSHLEITTIDVGNQTTNIIPDMITARFNARFSPLHTGSSLREMLEKKVKQLSHPYELQIKVSGEAFEGCSDSMGELYAQRISNVIGRCVALSVSGGTSDARFIKDLCPVMEMGLKHDQAHKINEHVKTSDLALLQKIYETVFIPSDTALGLVHGDGLRNE